jgi:hypothetical protein
MFGYISGVFNELGTDSKVNTTQEYSISGRFSVFDGEGFNIYMNPMFMKYFIMI